MTSNHKVIACVTLILLLTAVWIGPGNRVLADEQAPDFWLSDLSGKMTTLSEYRGQIILLDVWATWCFPCRMSIPELVKLQKKYRDKGFVILGVSMDDPGSVNDRDLRLFQTKHKINYPILRSNKSFVLDYFGNQAPAIPTAFLIDREGNIVEKIVGFNPGALRKALADVLG